MNLSVYISPCGIGLGHVTRTAPVAEELNRRCTKTVFSTYLDGLEYARSKHLPSFEAVPISFKVTHDGAIDFKRTAATSGFSLGIRTFLRQVTAEIQFMKLFRPNVVFSDSRASSLIAAKLLRIPVVLMLNQLRVEIVRRPSNMNLSTLDKLFFTIANLGWLFVRTAIQLVWCQSQAILIPDLPPPYTICLGNMGIPRRYRKKIKLIGPIAHSKRQHPSQAKTKRLLGLDARKTVVYAAVSGPSVERKVLTRKLVDALSSISDRYCVVISGGEPAGQSAPRSLRNITMYDWIDNQEDFINASDIMVSRAGHGIIMKSLLYGKPMVLIPIPDHTEQYSNARRATALGVAEMLDQNRVNACTLVSAVEKVFENRSYSINAKRVRDVAVTMNAVGQACDMITSFTSPDHP